MSGDTYNKSAHKDAERQVASDLRGKQTRQIGPGVSSITTANPVIGSLAPSAPPERAVSYQTSHIASPPSSYPFSTGRDVVEEKHVDEEAKGDDRAQTAQQGNHRDEEENDRHDDQSQNRRQHHGSDEHIAATGASNWKSWAITAIIALVCGVGGAWAYSALFGHSTSNKEGSNARKVANSEGGNEEGGKSQEKGAGKSGSAKTRTDGERGASASEIPGFTTANDADTLKKEIEHLAYRLDLLGGRIDRLTPPKQETPPVVHTLQTKINELERELDQVANLPSKMRQLEQRTTSLKEEFKSLKDHVAGEELPTGREVAPLDSAADAEGVSGEGHPRFGTADPADEATFKLAVGLLREGHYSQSYEVLRRLQRESPNDARVWYYSALANGLATDEWGGRTKRLAEQGLECEKAGSPPRVEIEAALAGLTTALGIDWLAEQRRQASPK